MLASFLLAAAVLVAAAEGRVIIVVLVVAAVQEDFSKSPVSRLILVQHTRSLLALVVSHNPRKANRQAGMVRALFSSLGLLYFMKPLAAVAAVRNVMA